MEILKLLEKSNCGECGQGTCLAFAVAVSRGQKRFDNCIRLASDIIEQFGGEAGGLEVLRQDMDEPLEDMKRRLKDIDLFSAARRLGAKYSNGKLTFKVLGANNLIPGSN